MGFGMGHGTGFLQALDDEDRRDDEECQNNERRDFLKHRRFLFSVMVWRIVAYFQLWFNYFRL
jgi:hypothetical protein